ncbi:MAG: hypothetical protein LBE03_00160, partial [Candidatus Nomurabacteria bacterium]|nr:hypothetical protein [Candidatus Nomurabacteria bacterium]
NKDKLYKKLRDRRARKAALVAGAIGFVVGVGTQEVAAFLSSNVLGGIEHLVNPNATGTKGTFLFDILNGKENGAMILAGATRTLEASDTMNNANTGGNGVVRLSGESSMVQNEDGTFSILDQRQGGQVKIDGLVQDSNTGQFTPESLQRLRESGYQVNVDSNTVLIEQAPASQTITQSVDQYLDGAKNQVTDVTRAFHFDNDSPGIYDYSELRFYADGVDASGNLSFSVGLDGVQPSHGGIAIDLHQEAAAGRLFAQIIPSGDHQGQAILAEIGANGKLNVSPDGPLAQFFSPDGKTLNAKFLEVVQVREDVTKNVVDGITQLTTTDGGAVDVAPIATWVGKNSLETITSVAEVPQPPIPTEIFHTSIVAPDLIEQIPTYITETDMPPIIPIVPRRSLRSAERRTPPRTTPETPPYGHNYGAEDQDFDRWRYWEETRNPILNENPNAELNPEEQLDFYTNQLIERRGVEYIGELEDYVTNNDALRNIDENVKLIVSIPVGAEQESENIYNTLSIYNKQTDSGKNSAVVLMNVNYKESAYNDPAKRILIDKTKSEIERAKHDFPNLKIASFEKVWPNDWVEQRDGKIYGEVVKVLYDTAAYAAKKAIDNRQIPADHDMLIVTNDADLLGMPSTYFDSYVKAEEKKPDQDAFIGSIRWGVEAIRDFPGYHVAQMFQQAMNLVATRRAGGKYVATIGPNAAFRVSSYAAVGGAEDLKFQGAGADSELGRKMLAARGKFFQRGGPNNNISYSTTDNEEIDGNPERQVISLVNGAQIDSDPARSLGQYRTGGEQIWMWNGFDSGQTRAEKATEGNLRPEDIERDFNDISRRITADINGYLNYWYKDEKLARTCLSILWSNGDTEKWRLVRRPNGTFDFKFTPDGLIVLKDGLLRARDTIPSNIYGRPNLKSSVRFVEGNRRYQIT